MSQNQVQVRELYQADVTGFRSGLSAQEKNQDLKLQPLSPRHRSPSQPLPRTHTSLYPPISSQPSLYANKKVPVNFNTRPPKESN